MFLECEDIFPWFNGIENNIVSKLFKVNYLNTSVWFEIRPFDNIFCCKLIDVLRHQSQKYSNLLIQLLCIHR